MTFAEAAMIMMSRGDSPSPSQSPLSLEGIKGLKTLATVTVGSFVWEIKEPKILYAGRIRGYTGTYDGKTYDYQQIEYPWWPSAVLNGVVAKVGDYYIYDYFRYGELIGPDGNSHSRYITKYSNFRISDPSDVFRSVQNTLYGFPQFTVIFGYTYEDGFDDDIHSYDSSSNFVIDFGSILSPCFTSLSESEYLSMAKSYYEAAKVNEPVINIL